MSEERFREFKEKYLDSERLSPEALQEISKLYLLGDEEIVRLACDEMHGHS